MEGTKKLQDAIKWRLQHTNWFSVLKCVTEVQSYYVGGTLVVDFPEGPFGMNLDNGKVTEMTTGIDRALTPDEHRLLFEVYRMHKGETQYYKKHLHLCPAEE